MRAQQHLCENCVRLSDNNGHEIYNNFLLLLLLSFLNAVVAVHTVLPLFIWLNVMCACGWHCVLSRAFQRKCARIDWLLKQ